MKLSVYILLLLFITVFSVAAQTADNFHNFLKNFPVATLPDTLQYSETEFDYDWYTPEQSEESDTLTADTASVRYQNSVLPKSDSLIISYESVKKFLLADSEKVTEFWEQDSPDTIFPTYYFIKKYQPSGNFYIVIYEKQFYFNASPYCQKILCTLNKSGKLISKIKVSSAEYSGTGILADDFRVPWFPDEKSIITKDLFVYYLKSGNVQTITIPGTGKTEQHADIIYQIDPKGRITNTGNTVIR